MAAICKARGLLLVAVIAFGGTLAAVGPASGQEPIRIGAFLSVTGPAAFLGDPEQKTLEMYVERINAGGGVIGPQAATGGLRRRRATPKRHARSPSG